jgi:peptidyl-prolyl cis-trans isomerase SurA
MGMTYYRENLEKFNPQYKAQMAEFREGNLLFEVMEKQVWSKAGQDSAGLRKFYEEHKGKYSWAPSADVLVFTASDRKTGEEALAALKKDPQQWRKLVEAQSGKLMGDSARVEISQISGLGIKEVKPGAYAEVSAPDPDGAVSFGHIVRVYPQSSQRSFEEARGLVMNDYQLFLEEKWVESLKKKYPVVVNQAEWKKILSLQ